MPVPVSRATFLAVLPPSVQPNTLHQRSWRGEVPYTYESAVRKADEFDALDPFAVRLAEALSAKINKKMASALTNHLMPMWSDGVSIAEAHPTGEQCYLVIADMGEGDYRAAIGPLARAAEKLPTNAARIIAISLHRLLADLKADAQRAGVDLPRKLAPEFLSPEYVQWRAAIDAPKQAEVTRAFIQARDGEVSHIAAVEAQAKRLRREVRALRRKDIDVAPALEALASLERTVANARLALRQQRGRRPKEA
jgi:hypothetical protein